MSTRQWHNLGRAKYHKWTVYDMKWRVSHDDIEFKRCAACAFGGPLAIAPNNIFGALDSLSASGADTNGGNESNAKIYNGSGNELGTLVPSSAKKWRKMMPMPNWRLVVEGGFGWTVVDQEIGLEALIVVEASGNVSFFTILGKQFFMKDRTRGSCFPANIAIDGSKVLLAYISRSGIIVAMLSSGKIVAALLDGCTYVLKSINEIKLNNEDDVLCLSILQGHASASFEEIKILLSVRGSESAGRLLLVSKKEIVRIDEQADMARVHKSAVLRIAISPNGRFVAFFTQNGFLQVCNSSFSRTVLEFETKANIPPLQLAWCGEDCVVMQWSDLGLLLVGPYGSWLKFTYSRPVVLVQEIDCIRIIGAFSTELLQRVHPSVQAIHGIGSISPAAMYFDAVKGMAQDDYRADMSLRAIKADEKLSEAVKECIRAACAEFDSDMQRDCLKAASTGKVFCELDSERRECTKEFLLACQALRVLNVVRSSQVGLPLTMQQYEALTPVRLVARLSSLRMHFLALKVSSYLDLPSKARILMDWATAKVKSNLGTSASLANIMDPKISLETEAEVFEAIHAKVAPIPGIRFSRLSRMAQCSGKNTLSSLLAHAEPVSWRRGLQLLRLEEYTKSIAYAIHANDYDLLLFSIISFAAKMGKPGTKDAEAMDRATVLSSIGQFPIARQVFARYLERCEEFSTLKEFLHVCDRPHDAATVTIKEAYFAKTLPGRFERLGVALEIYKASKKSGRESRGNTSPHFRQFCAQSLSCQIKLLRIQKDLEEVTGKRCFVDNSLVDTIFNCLVLKLNKKAQSLKAEFKCSEQMYTYISIKALAQLQDWIGLRSIAAQKRLPVSRLAIVQACMDAGNLDEARFYALHLDDNSEKLQAFILTKWWENAVNIAVDENDMASLQLIRTKCEDEELKASILNRLKPSA